MKKSVRFRITIIFIAIVAVLIAALFLSNLFFLNNFYTKEKVSTIKDAYEAMDEMIRQTSEEGLDFWELIRIPESQRRSDPEALLRRISDRSNIDVVIMDTESNAMAGLSRDKEWLIEKLHAYREFSDAMNNGQIPDSMFKILERNDNYIIQMNYDRRTGGSNLECWGTFSNENLAFLMTMPIESIQESTRITSRFILIVGSALLVLGSLVIYFATAAITRPINSLAVISKKMSDLDFSEKYTGNRQDEIGILGESMNSLSSNLEKTIGDLQEANEKLQEANDKLKETNLKLQEDIDLKEKVDTMRKEFISNVSHELKTPIALIQGYAEGLEEGIAEDPESRKYYCDVIMDEASKMNVMVSQLTSLTRYEFGEDTAELEYFDLSDLIRNELAKEKIRFDEAGADVQCNIPDKCIVHADEFKIEEVLTNYLSNAIHHLDGNRRILVEIKPAGESRIRLNVYNDGKQIPDESMDRIWEKFYKVDKARTRAYGGGGIGLSIVKAIADAHGQECGAENLPEGVLFYITLDALI